MVTAARKRLDAARDENWLSNNEDWLVAVEFNAPVS
jgi:hypothetical protein